METEWRIGRARLRELLQENGQACHGELAQQLGYSVAWVRKWRKRLAQAAPDDDQVLLGQSHRPKHIPRRVREQVEERIVALREALSEQYNRTVGARTIAIYLKREAAQWEGVVPDIKRHHLAHPAQTAVYSGTEPTRQASLGATRARCPLGN